jgi:hypothetical protein
MIVGESLFGVFLAGMVVGTDNAEPFGLVPPDAGWPAMIAAIVGFIAIVWGLYAWIRGKAAKV